MKKWLLAVLSYRQAEALRTALACALYCSGFAWLLGLFLRRGACILVYHSVSEQGVFWDSALPARRFAEQLDYLTATREVVPMARLLEVLRAGRAPPKHWVVVTFDDGYADNRHTAWPLLRDRRLTAAFYVTTGVVTDGRSFFYDRLQRIVETTREPCVVLRGDGAQRRYDLSSPAAKREAVLRMVLGVRHESDERREEFVERVRQACGLDPAAARDLSDLYLRPEDVRALSGEGCEIGSHTLSHPSLARLDGPELEKEVTESKQRLERIAGRPVVGLAYPFGKSRDLNAATDRALRRAGYAYALTTRFGQVTAASDPMALPRVGVRDASLLRFKVQLMGLPL